MVPSACTLPRMRPLYKPLGWRSTCAGYSAVQYFERDARAAKLYLDNTSCTPAVFVPGQGGDFKQVRSLASKTALKSGGRDRMSADGGRRRQICWYSLDLRSELAFLDPALLSSQIHFARCMLQEVYRRHKHAVIIVGHSVGALTARIAAQATEPKCVEAIVGLASPSRADMLMPSVAGSILLKRARSVGDIATVDICGGKRDLQAPLWACGSATSTLKASTLSLRGVYTPVDHNAMVWCDELISLLGDALTKLPEESAKTAASDLPSPSKSPVVYNVHQYIEMQAPLSQPDEEAVGPMLIQQEQTAEAMLKLGPRVLAMTLASTLWPSMSVFSASAIVATIPQELSAPNATLVSLFAGIMGQFAAALSARALHVVAIGCSNLLQATPLRLRQWLSISSILFSAGHQAAIAFAAAMLSGESALGSTAIIVAALQTPSFFSRVHAMLQAYGAGYGMIVHGSHAVDIATSAILLLPLLRHFAAVQAQWNWPQMLTLLRYTLRACATYAAIQGSLDALLVLTSIHILIAA